MKRSGKFLAVLAASAMTLGLGAANVSAAGLVATGTQKVYIVGDDWGPAVTKTIITFDKKIDASSLDKNDFTVQEVKEITADWSTGAHGTGTADRKVENVYLSNAKGTKSTAKTGKTVTIEMYTSPSDGSPFIYDLKSGYNNWCSFYKLNVALAANAEVTTQGQKLTGVNVDASIALSTKKQSVFDSTTTAFTEHTYDYDDQSYTYGEYKPASDGKKNALVIWLNGAGEGGTDNYIDLLGNKVTALASTEFQKNFNGAYVITPQAPTFWMNGGDGKYQNGDKGSMYSQGLYSLIREYVATHSDIDANRIIIGGCSNGGYMTMEMVAKHPNYFAAAYPICEALQDQYITDSQITALAKSKTGIWYSYAKTDTTVDYTKCTEPTYARLKAAGMTNLHKTVWDNVVDTTGRFTKSSTDTSAYEYNGHWSWIYFDNNKNTEGSLNEWSWLSTQTKSVINTTTTKVTKAKSSKKKKLTVKLSAKTGITGYEIAYRKKGSSKWTYVKTTSATKTLTKLSSKKYYYVKARTYITTGTTNDSSAWSASKKAKIK